MMNADEVRALLRRRCDEAGGQAVWAGAEEPKLSPAYVSDVLNGHRGLGQKILDRLGLEVAYRDAAPHGPSQRRVRPVKTKRGKPA